MKGHIVAPTFPTCGKKVYDYFVVSVGLKYSLVGVAVIDDAGCFPYMPVRLILKGRPKAEGARVLVVPRKLPACILKGCVRECREAVAEQESSPCVGSKALTLNSDAGERKGRSSFSNLPLDHLGHSATNSLPPLWRRCT